jgi:hypothetical protein
VNVLGIVKEYLNERKYSGLIHGDDCCCETEFICDDITKDCQPGYKVPCDCDCGCDFHMTRRKPNERN